MNKKLLSTTYLRETTQYQIRFYLDEEDKYVVAKKLERMTEPFIIGDGIIGMDNGYYILEIVPKNKNYALRIFINDKKEVIEYYFDIIAESGIDKETKIPYFMDAYLDIVFNTKDRKVIILDRDELEDALKTNNISKANYDMALRTQEELLKEIKNNTNDLLKIDYLKYIKDM